MVITAISDRGRESNDENFDLCPTNLNAAAQVVWKIALVILMVVFASNKDANS